MALDLSVTAVAPERSPTSNLFQRMRRCAALNLMPRSASRRSNAPLSCHLSSLSRVGNGRMRRASACRRRARPRFVSHSLR